MMLRSPLAAAALSLVFVAGSAAAQSPGQRVIIEQSGSPRQEGSVRVQSSVNFFVAGPSGDSEEAQKLRDRARRSVYEMAGRECDLLREVLARECRMESVNINLNRQFGQQQTEGFNINASMSFQITLK